MSYMEVAILAGKPLASRAVGNMLGANRESEIPCHRVIKSDTRAKRSVEMKTKSSSTGKVGGHRYGVKKKVYLLRKEDQRE